MVLRRARRCCHVMRPAPICVDSECCARRVEIRVFEVKQRQATALLVDYEGTLTRISSNDRIASLSSARAPSGEMVF